MEVSASPTAVQLALSESSGEVFSNPAALSVALPIASFSQAGILSAADYKKLGNSAKPFYHIECDSSRGELIVKYPAEVIAAGYIPYLLRYSRKKPRYCNVVQTCPFSHSCHQSAHPQVKHDFNRLMCYTQLFALLIINDLRKVSYKKKKSVASLLM